ncbi:MAG TPA: PRC-barrel domain-containing protein [Ktedonobacteraceae bacterium]
MAGEFLSWSEISDRPVYLAGQGRQIGLVDDFYYDPDTQSITALRVKTHLNGSRVLLASAIALIDLAGVTIANQNMLIDEANAGHIYQLPRGQQLLGSRVVSEQGRELGVVGSLLLGVSPPVALRISAIDLRSRGSRRISAHALLSIEEGTLVVMEQEG